MFVLSEHRAWLLRLELNMSEIAAMTVAASGLTQLIENMGRDCSPTQFLREFTRNSFEACERTGKAGLVVVDVHPQMLEEGHYKMAITDNGDGMSDEDLLNNINRLSASGGHINRHKNYGLGAKIAAITRNPAGLIYRSWQNGEGHQVVLAYDPDTEAYGAVPQEEDGSMHYVQALSDDMKPKEIKDHGTQVILIGMEETSDTMKPPSGVIGSREAWIAETLNTRYFEIPKDVTLKVRIGYYRDPSITKHFYLREVKGQKKTLEDKKILSEKGVCSLDGASIHWFILKPNRDKQGHGRTITRGHTGVLNQQELFSLADGRSNRAQNFGIIFGREDVVLYIEPDPHKYSQNTSRTQVVKNDGSDLPWNRWYDDFQKQMPNELKEFIKKRMGESSAGSSDKSIKEKLRKNAQFYKISRYLSDPKGNSRSDDSHATAGNFGTSSAGSAPAQSDPSSQGNSEGRQDKSSSTDQGSGSSTNGSTRSSTSLDKSTNVDAGQPVHTGRSTRSILFSGTVPKGTKKTKRVSVESFPNVRWVDFKSEYPELIDRAGKYAKRENEIHINTNFRGYRDVLEHFLNTTGGGLSEAETIIKDTVREQFELLLSEVVTGALAFQNRPGWKPDEFDAALSPEALSAAAMSRFYMMQQINRNLKNRLSNAAKSLN